SNLGSHSLDYIEWFCGRIVRLDARLFPDEPGALDRRVELRFELASGAIGTFSLATDLPHGRTHRVELYGDRGALRLTNDSDDHARGFSLSVGGTPRLPTDDGEEVDDSLGAGDSRIAPVSQIARAFIDRIFGQRTSCPDLHDGVRVAELTEVIQQSSARA